ncbi:MAG TPA: hypothetical protein VF644_05105 [Pyrinomonadaceae bacterium]|jgi:hypothetical protein
MKVGITGHQNIGSTSEIKWVENSLIKAIREYKVSEGFTCLAVGADQLFAEILLKESIPCVAIIPSHNYEKTFENENDYKNYETLLSSAHKVIELNFEKPSEIAFFEAGKKVVNCSDIVFAIWDGKPVEGLGGTADVVEYAVMKNKAVIHFNPETQKVNIK